MDKFSTVVSDEILQKTIDALKANGITSEVVATRNDAKKRILEILPKGAEVMTMTSITLQETGIADAINTSTDYDSVRNKLNNMDRKTQNLEMQKLGAAPDWTVGSVHAITEDGVVFIASNTGSQLPAYVYGSLHVLWVVGAQKIVADETEAKKRIYEYILPRESVRLRKQYNLPETVNSNVSKLLAVHKEFTPDRVHIVFVKEPLGF